MTTFVDPDVTISPGDAATAAWADIVGNDLLFLKPLVARKTATESVTSTTALQNDDALVVAVEATYIYELQSVVIYDGDSAGDFKFDYTLPSGASFTGSVTRLATGAVDQSAQIQAITESGAAAGALGAAFNCALVIRGVVVVSSTAGSVQFRWAQNTSNGTATRVFANSHIVLRRIA